MKWSATAGRSRRKISKCVDRDSFINSLTARLAPSSDWKTFCKSSFAITMSIKLSILKKKMQREGVFREMKRRKAYEKPSERKTREKAEAIRRARKAARKLAQREGLIPMPKRREAAPRRAPPRF